MARPEGGRQLRPGPGPLLPLRLLLLLGVLLVRSGAAERAEPCQAPRQWEGRTVFYEHGSGRNTRAAVSYDGPNQRLRILEERKALIPCKKQFLISGIPSGMLTTFCHPKQERGFVMCAASVCSGHDSSRASIEANGKSAIDFSVCWIGSGVVITSPFPCGHSSTNHFPFQDLEVRQSIEFREALKPIAFVVTGEETETYLTTTSFQEVGERNKFVGLDCINNKQNSNPPGRQVNRFFEYILLYKDAVMFQIEQVTKLCSKIALTEPWDPYDIPANSTYEDQYYIGGPGDEIMTGFFSFGLIPMSLDGNIPLSMCPM
ncbi:hypothetical protein BTVI_46473 [Pitangus sulphuratus]|nr:hypothetical protein BTVI_46473 [Pitangus sulphuratus]